DAMVVFGFDAALAGLTAQAFVDERLVGNLGVGGVVTGADFTFGKARGGNVAVLAALGQANGFACETVSAVTAGDDAVSSSRIRDLLKDGDPMGAARLLTRPFAIQGQVQHGDKVGRTIGYPTANIDMGSYLRPAYGIYAVRARLSDGRVLDGAANIGIRPTFDPPKELLEVYLFDFAEDLYGQMIEVQLIAYLRPEAKFDGLEALVTQMDADCAAARLALAAS
ncbi:MAG: riboflavin biosynthesis protein RibF, partial [Sphingomonas sp.]|nr:riboflavin biosynthesis protein RibF [Sphingomonas sp.]